MVVGLWMPRGSVIQRVHTLLEWEISKTGLRNMEVLTGRLLAVDVSPHCPMLHRRSQVTTGGQRTLRCWQASRLHSNG